MRIGILLGLDPSHGGIYQYSLTMLNALRESKPYLAGDDLVTFSGNFDNQLKESFFDVNTSKYSDPNSTIEYPSDYPAGERAVACLELKK